MTPAPVGFQCPDCVAAGAAATRTERADISQFRPWVSWTLVGICVGVYLVQWAVGVNDVAAAFGMYPRSIAFENEWYRLLTSVFLHGSLLHLAFNSYVLFVLGPTLERILGHAKFLLLFMVAGLGGAAASYAFSAPTTISVGASGAIFGLMGALLVAGRRLRYDVTMVVVLIALNLVIGFVFASGIDWRAHLGGLATGAAMAAVMVSPHGRHRRATEWIGVAVIIAVIVGLVAWRTSQLLALVG